MSKALRSCLKTTVSVVGVLILLGSMALSALAIPVLLLALFWLV